MTGSAMVDALVIERGLTPEQAYCLFSVAGDLRISSIVNTPHALVSALLPQSIFEP
jgi:formamidase